MTKNKRVGIAELNTHIMYIRESINEINDKIDKLPCIDHKTCITANEIGIKNLKDARRKEFAILGTVMGIIIFIVNVAMKLLNF